MADQPYSRLEFRIPISPTPGFYSQVRFFDFALRRLGLPYSDAKVSVYVGDDCDLDAVRAANGWSARLNVDWIAVPSDVFAEFGIHGTADWRWIPPASKTDLVILSDADTVLLRGIGPLLSEMPKDMPAIRGHMAHHPPPSSGGGLPASDDCGYWPALFTLFDVPWPTQLFSYSIGGKAGLLSNVPAYFNLGMVAVNPLALEILGRNIFDFQRQFAAKVDSHMRCQISPSLLAYREMINIEVLPAAYNAANDVDHMRANFMSVEDIRVLHYLRGDEFDRSVVFQDRHLDAFLSMTLSNPANQAIQMLAQDYRRSRSDLDALQ